MHKPSQEAANLDRETMGAGSKACPELTWDLDEGVPDAGATAVLVRHPLHLVSRRRCPKRESHRERRAAQLTSVHPRLRATRCLLLPSGVGSGEEHKEEKEGTAEEACHGEGRQWGERSVKWKQGT